MLLLAFNTNEALEGADPASSELVERTNEAIR